MKTILSTILLAALIAGPAMAQKDERATPILSKVSETYRNTPCHKSEFSLKIVDPEGEISDQQKGTIILQNEKYILELSSQKIISDGLAVWTYHSDINEVQIEEADAGDGSLSPSKIFTMYESGFKYKYVGENNENGKKIHRVDLFPESNDKSYFKVELSIDAVKNIIQQASIHDKNGSKYIYEISSFTKLDKMSDEAFTFNSDKYPGIEVVDLR